MELAQFPAMGELDGRLEIRDGPPLGAGLEHPAVTPHRLVERLAQCDGDAAGLLAVDVLAGLHGQDGTQGVPVVAGGDQHGVDVGPSEQIEHVAIHGAIVVAILLVGHGLDRLAALGPDVAYGHELHVRLGHHALDQVVPAARADADGPQHDAFAGRHQAVAAQGPPGNKRRQRRRPGQGQRLLQKCAASQRPPGESFFIAVSSL